MCHCRVSVSGMYYFYKCVLVTLEVFGKSRKSFVPHLTCAPHPATPHSQTLAAMHEKTTTINVSVNSFLL
jgi:hypothetical protein